MKSKALKSEGLDEAIQYFERIEIDLADGTKFFQLHAERYREVCVRAAFQTLIANKPDDLDDATWRENAVEFVDLITTAAFQNQLDISFVSRTELDRMAARNRGQNLANFTPITYEDIEAFVKADPEDGGKDKDLFKDSERMMTRNEKQIIYDVQDAIRQHRLGVAEKDFSGITQRLEDWVNSRVLKGDLDSLLSLVLQSWETVMTPILERDLTEWVDDVIRLR